MKKQVLSLTISLLIAIMAQAQLKVTSTGMVGIGTITPFTNSKLDVEGNVYIPSGSSYWIGATGDAGNRLRMLSIGTEAYIDYCQNLHFRNGINDAVIFSNIGHIGIGTGASDLYTLNINGGASSAIALQVNQNADWGQSMTSSVTRINTLSYVVQYANTVRFSVYGDGTIYAKGAYYGSDSILKKNIKPISSSSLSKIKLLKGMNYDFKIDSSNKMLSSTKSISATTGNNGHHYGFIAQDIEKVLPDLVATMHDGTKAVNYIEIIPFIVEAMKEQSKTIDSLTSCLTTVNKQLSDIQSCCKGSGKTKSDVVSSDESNSTTIIETTAAKLYQNAPNPFKESTTIKLEIPETVQSAMVCIYDLNGRQLKCLTVSGRGTTSVQIFGNELTAGLYHYALIADGALIDTKTMVLTN